MTRVARALAAALLCLVAAAALASDRPYLAATNAVADEDDDNVIALESWIESARRYGEFRFEPEYNFDPRNAVRFELSIARDRRFEPVVRSRSVEVEFKHLVTDLARSGFGSGVIVGVDWDERRGVPDASEDKARRSWALGVAGLLTLRPTPDTLFHINLGAIKETAATTRARWALALEHEVVLRTTLFAEAGARAGEQRLLHGGVRHWVKRDRFAVDLTVGCRRGEPASSTFITLGIALQDIYW
jgi:hypothetical protein